MNNLKKIFTTFWGRLSVGKRPKDAGAKAPFWRRLLASVGIHVMHHKKWSLHLGPRFFLAIGVCMAFGIVGDELMVRVGPDAYEACLARPHAREMDFTGRAMKGIVYVGTDGFAEDDDLAAWLARGLEFAGSLPAKEKRRR